MFNSVLESLDEIPQKEINSLKNFVKEPKGNALMIIGKSGTGKTSSVYKLAEEINYEVYELNASDFRDEQSINELVGRASKEGSLFKGRIILIDDVEGMSGREDRGGVGALSELIKESRWPIIITATDGNEIYDKKFKTLRSKCKVIKFNPVNVLSVVKILKNVKERNNLKISEENLKEVARRSGGDVRAALNDFFSVSMDNDLSGMEWRDNKENIFNAMRIIFKSLDRKNIEMAFNNLDINLDEIPLWLEENLPLEYYGKELSDAFNAMSKADVFKGRIRKRQYYRLLVYVRMLLSLGVAFSKDKRSEGFVGYKRGERLLKMWIMKNRYKEKYDVAEELSKYLHCSKKKVLKEVLPYFRFNKMN
ncbi:replication factor C large subunit [Candidatus Woesearchaeota archaeon]|nr:replication factor C large subunit [Candidatus Woesearchaeota archaeon]